MIAEILLKLLGEQTALSSGFINSLETGIRPEIYKPHQIIHAAGNIEHKLFFIENGFARNYFYDQFGEEHTVRFWEPLSMIFSCEGYYKVSSCFYIEILTECKLLSLSYDRLLELEKAFPETALLIRYCILQHQKDELDRLKLISLPAKERYVYLRKNSNHLFSKISSKIIASYLHLSRETLSRYMSSR